MLGKRLGDWIVIIEFNNGNESAEDLLNKAYVDANLEVNEGAKEALLKLLIKAQRQAFYAGTGLGFNEGVKQLEEQGNDMRMSACDEAASKLASEYFNEK
jgi:hypothetical protein